MSKSNLRELTWEDLSANKFILFGEYVMVFEYAIYRI